MQIRIFLAALALLSGLAMAADRPAPASWSLGGSAEADLASIGLVRFDALDLVALAAEDAGREAMGEPPRFAWPHATAFTTDRHGRWDQHGDTAIWRFRVQAEAANLINFGFAHVRLPEGSRLYIYSPKAALDRAMDRFLVIGPYDARINRSHGEFWTPNLQGDDAIVELNVPAARRAELSFEIAQVSHGYRGFGEAALGYHQASTRAVGDGKQSCRDEGGGRSGACNQDVACLSEDDPWNEPRSAVGAYQRSGSFACTGSLVNNTANDQRMLFMTARHCISPAQTASIVVYWNYEWPTCRRPGAAGGTAVNPPDPNITNSGGSFLASTSNPFQGNCTAPNECSDVFLLELNDPANPDFGLFWAGWDRRPPPTVCAQGPGSSTAGLCATIHHPGVHEKRITWVAQDMQVGNIAGAQNIHWHPFWHPNPPELPNMPGGPPATIPPAVTEGGSSGSPLYSADRRLLGVLSGGPAFCGATGASLSDFYGGLWHAWDGMGTATTRMRDYLDPLGTAPLFIDGTGRDGFALEVDGTELSQCGFDDLLIAIEIEAQGEFDEPVSLSVNGLPKELSSAFSDNPVTPPGSSTLTLGNLSEAGNGPFSFSLQGDAGELSRALEFSVFLADEAPEAAVVISPANGAIGVPTQPTITWTAELGNAFALEIATDPDFDTVIYSVAVTTTSHTVAQTLETSTVHYLRVRAANDCDSADWSTVVAFTTEALPGDCPVGTTALDLLSENFAGGSLPAGWSTAGSTGAVGWVPSTAQAHSGSHSMFAQNIATVSDQRLTTAPVSLPEGAVSMFLNFQNWQSIESVAGGCYDGGLLEVSTNDGASWSQVTEDLIVSRDYDGPISGSHSNPLGGLPGWCGDPRDFWERYTVNLSGWAGETLRFRFRFGTDSSVSRVGWYVDSVEVRACFAGDPYSLGGTVSGLEGAGLVLQNNGGNDLPIPDNGSFEFSVPVFDGQDYEVTVAQQPVAPFQDCQVSNGSGTVDGADISDVEVVCVVLPTFSIGGTVSGLNGSGLVLQNNQGDDLAILDNGSFEFAETLLDQQAYAVTVAVQPTQPSQSCTVNNGGGIVDGADVTNVEVVCEDRIATLFGTVTSLGYCQADPAAVEAADVAVSGQLSGYATQTGVDGDYDFQIRVDESPVTVEVTASGHATASVADLPLSDAAPTEQNFDLLLLAACAQTDLDSVALRLVIATQAEAVVTLSNALGGVALDWSLRIDPGCYDPLTVPWLALSASSGQIAAGDQQAITANVDAGELEEGFYQTVLCLDSSDSNKPSIDIDVQLEVVGPDLFQDRFEASE